MTDPAFVSSLRVMCRDEETFRRVWAVVEPEVEHLGKQAQQQAEEIEGLCVELARVRKLLREYETLAANSGLL